jgi:hypothetical protein
MGDWPSADWEFDDFFKGFYFGNSEGYLFLYRYSSNTNHVTLIFSYTSQKMIKACPVAVLWM